MPSRDQAKNRAAVKRHYDSHPIYYREKNARARKRKAEFIQERRKVPCTDCGNTFPYYVMEFDHREDKKYSIARMSSNTWNQLLTELDKCDVVCANCHCVRTHERRNARVCTPKAEGQS